MAGAAPSIHLLRCLRLRPLPPPQPLPFARSLGAAFHGRGSTGFLRGTGPGPLPQVEGRCPSFGVSSLTSRGSFASSAAMGSAAESLPWKIELVPCLKDNYAYLIFNSESKKAAVVDPSEAVPVEKATEGRGLTLTHVLCTHHHWDHTGGNLDLKAKYNAQVVGPAADKERIPGIDIALADGEEWDLHGLSVKVLHTPGHTRGHCSFYLPQLDAVFTGDTLFSLGCGRLFEGTPSQMWTSLSRLAALPETCRIYCGHEYTMSNAKFALSMEPRNASLQARASEVQELRSKNLPTIPSTIKQEVETNPFLRPQAKEIKDSVHLSHSASDVDVFAAVRQAKDNF